MLRNYLYLSILGFALYFTSCEVPVDIDLDEDRQIAVISRFSEDQDLKVFVSKTRILSSESDSLYVDDAIVQLYSEEESLYLTLDYIRDANPPFYTTTEFSPVIGRTYLLIVKVPEYPIVTATTTIPFPVPTNEITFEDISVSIDDTSTEVNFNVRVTIEDPVEHDNFYHLLFEQDLLTYELDANGDTLYTDKITYNTDDDITLNLVTKTIPMEQLFGDPSFLINDGAFNGETISLDFSGKYFYDPSKFVLGDFKIELRSVPESYYYHFQALLDDPKNPDVGILTGNINNGIGYFAGYSSNTKGFRPN